MEALTTEDTPLKIQELINQGQPNKALRLFHALVHAIPTTHPAVIESFTNLLAGHLGEQAHRLVGDRYWAEGQLEAARNQFRQAAVMARPESSSIVTGHLDAMERMLTGLKCKDPGGEVLSEKMAVSVIRWQPPKRRFLVCIRAGAHSLHREWFKPDKRRCWDLMVSYYQLPDDGVDPYAELILSGGPSKFTAHKLLVNQQPVLLSWYDAVMFLDDDLQFEHDSLNGLFWHFCRYEMVLAQPALTHSSNFTWPVTLVCPAFQVRFTNFVEIMMPIFSRNALEVCVSTFDSIVSGWGLDFVWPKLLGSPRTGIGIVDAIAFTHSKPVDLTDGPFYRHLRGLGVDPKVEMQNILEQHGIREPIPRIYGGVSGSSAEGAELLLFA